MRERSEQWLRISCWVVGAVLLLQIVRTLANVNPLGQVRIPELPALSVASLASGKGTNTPSNSLGKATNTAAATSPGSNSPAAGKIGPSGTNASQIHHIDTNRPTAAVAAASTNSAVENAKNLSTNAAGISDPGRRITGAASPRGPTPPGMMPPGMRGPGPKPPELPPAIMARVDRVVDSEVLGPIMRPLPMALLGIAGDAAFLRAPTGQMGMVKEGENLGTVKLLRIGINRVLVEQDGQKKELMIFSGFGGEPLLQQDHP